MIHTPHFPRLDIEAFKRRGPKAVLTKADFDLIRTETHWINFAMDYADSPLWIDYSMERLEALEAVLSESLARKRQRNTRAKAPRLALIKGGAS